MRVSAALLDRASDTKPNCCCIRGKSEWNGRTETAETHDLEIGWKKCAKSTNPAPPIMFGCRRRGRRIEQMSTSSRKKGEVDSAQKCPFTSKSKVADDSLSAPSPTSGDANAKSTDMMTTTDQSASSSSSSVEKAAAAGANTTGSTTMDPNDSKVGDNAALNDPTKFWAAWSARKQHDCLDGDGSSKKGCNCFEGLGSVM